MQNPFLFSQEKKENIQCLKLDLVNADEMFSQLSHWSSVVRIEELYMSPAVIAC